MGRDPLERDPCMGGPTLPALLVQEDAVPSPLPPLDLCRQLRCSLGNGSDFRFHRGENKLGCLSQTQDSCPLPPLAPANYRKQDHYRKQDRPWACRTEGGGHHGNCAGLWLWLREGISRSLCPVGRVGCEGTPGMAASLVTFYPSSYPSPLKTAAGVWDGYGSGSDPA